MLPPLFTLPKLRLKKGSNLPFLAILLVLAGVCKIKRVIAWPRGKNAKAFFAKQFEQACRLLWWCFKRPSK
jgi:hypothetical protein